MVVTGLVKSALDLALKHLNINIELKKKIVVDYIWRRILFFKYEAVSLLLL